MTKPSGRLRPHYEAVWAPLQRPRWSQAWSTRGPHSVKERPFAASANKAEARRSSMTHTASSAAAPDGFLERLVAFARRRPGAVLITVLAAHLVVWTVLPILTCPNLQLDLAEDLALGKEWQLGYWKHPPLP